MQGLTIWCLIVQQDMCACNVGSKSQIACLKPLVLYRSSFEMASAHGGKVSSVIRYHRRCNFQYQCCICLRKCLKIIGSCVSSQSMLLVDSVRSEKPEYLDQISSRRDVYHTGMWFKRFLYSQKWSLTVPPRASKKLQITNHHFKHELSSFSRLELPILPTRLQ